MPTIVGGVNFDTIAREWRWKWSSDADKKSLQETNEILDMLIDVLKATPNVKSVQRIVCGACNEFKVITAMPASKFGEWEKKSFAPEAKFLDAVKKVSGITDVETQTYTLMPVLTEAPSLASEPEVPQPATITKGVSFDIVCREWRCKWDAGSDKLSLKRAQAVLDKYTPALPAIEGLKYVQRIVCGGCLDFKVIISITLPKWKKFEQGKYFCEEGFLAELKEIDGISKVETQTYTIKTLHNYEVPVASICNNTPLGDGLGAACWVGHQHSMLWLDEIAKLEKVGESQQESRKITLEVEDYEVEEPLPPIWQTKKRGMIPMKKVTIKVDHPMTCPAGWMPGDDESNNDYIKYIYARDQDDEIRICRGFKPTDGKAECEAIIEPDAYETLIPFACSHKGGLMKGDKVSC
eukprot:gnl/MRDRNA2_/MRDRNA2_38886_c0_seq1.p1 gnl/MRDRNA2_/MRDRNA2_38886_c0~~gnl/MRDRNA2_/MRDRNA2_38886_c0_seq1.p1  ORF type:complete len:408 (+),score=99.15 gnl/MRDRNA2_/MRDRNA2_38886_c0_seq1:66-1289(+)